MSNFLGALHPLCGSPLVATLALCSTYASKRVIIFKNRLTPSIIFLKIITRLLAYVHFLSYLCRKLVGMENSNTHFVYQQPAIEFVTVAVQLCIYLEKLAEYEREEFIDKMLSILPLLYLKARLVPKSDLELDGYIEQFVSEYEYEQVRQAIATQLGTDDTYLEVYMEDMRYSDEPITAFISENIADIYQEMKDLACNYQTQNESVMNDALVACLEAFEQHWGQKLLNVLRPLHALSLSNDE